MGWQAEFTDFDPATMPAIPEGFEDESWCNDTCPSFHNAELELTIFVDYADPAMREIENEDRFSLSEDPRDARGSRVGVMTLMLATSDWNEILQKLADIKSELDRQSPEEPLDKMFPEGIPQWMHGKPRAEIISLMNLRRTAFPATIPTRKE